MEQFPSLKEEHTPKQKQESVSLAFGPSFEKTPATELLAHHLTELHDAILSDAVAPETIETLQSSLENLYASQKELLSKKVWELYNQRLPEGMRYVVLREGSQEYTNVQTLEGHTSFVLVLQVLPDGTIVSGHESGTIKIWEKDTEGNYTPTQTLKERAGSVLTLQVLPDGTIVSGHENNTIKIWKQDAKGCYISTPIQTLEGHTNYVRTLQVLPDGTIVSGSDDSTIKIWKP